MILALDTSGTQCCTVLWDGEVVAQAQPEGQLRHNELLLFQMQRLLAESKVLPEQLQAVVVSSGPGSFTGLRVGMAVAKGLCWSWNLPLIAIPTLDGIAAGVPNRFPQVLALMPARAREVYWRLFQNRSGNWEPKGELSIGEIGSLGSMIAGAVFLCGEGYELHRAELDVFFTGRVLSLEPGETLPSLAVNTARLAEKRLKLGQVEDLKTCEPQYCYAYPRIKAANP